MSTTRVGMTYAGWLLAAGLVLGVTTVGDAAPAPMGQGERRVVRVKAERFLFMPSEIKMTVGEEVEIRLKSDDTAHGFRVVGTDTDVVIPKRGSGEASVVFKATKVGRLTFECSKMCGAGHHFMRGQIVVVDPDAHVPAIATSAPGAGR